MKKRTDVDFSKHEMIVEKNDNFMSHQLKIPGTYINSVLFINTNDILAVTGDYGNWIFCREFHPSPSGTVCDQYWIEKLKIGSCQEPYDFDSDVAKNEIEELLKEHELTDEEKSWLSDLSDAALQGEYSFIAEAMQRPYSFETEMIPRGHKIKYWLSVVFDAFEEVCSREKQCPTCKGLGVDPVQITTLTKVCTACGGTGIKSGAPK